MFTAEQERKAEELRLEREKAAAEAQARQADIDAKKAEEDAIKQAKKEADKAVLEEENRKAGWADEKEKDDKLRLERQKIAEVKAEKEAAEPEAKKEDEPIDTTKFAVKITQEGEGPTVPQGVRAKVHYTGTLLDGTKFDSSRDRGQPFQFTVGVGQVIKCWDEGFQQMRKGTKAIFNCPPDYAYGSRATGPIPANSTLRFDVEVIDF